MKKSVYLLSAITLVLASCMKKNVAPEVAGVDPNLYDIELKQTEFRKEGQQWVPISNGDTLRLSWSQWVAESAVWLKYFGPGDFTNTLNSNTLLSIGKNGTFSSNGENIFFGNYDNTKKVTVVIDSGRYRLEGDYFHLKKMDMELKFRVLKGNYNP